MNAKQEQLLVDLFMGEFNDPFENPRMAKCRSLWALAKAAPLGGCIVELGTYRGCGALSLGFGAKKGVKVYTVDDFEKRRGWANEPYGPEDKIAFEKALAASKLKNITLVETQVERAGQDWAEPVALCYWDLISPRLPADFALWGEHLIPGGVFAIHDTADHRFLSDQVIAAATRTGKWEFGERMPGYIQTLVKR